MAHEKKLMKVKGNGCHLQWPVPPFPEEFRSRGGQGYVVDLGHPLECGYDVPALHPNGQPKLDAHGRQVLIHVPGWCEGQLHKLEEAPEAKEPNAIDIPAARILLHDWDKAHAPKAEAPASTQPPAPAPAPEPKAQSSGRKTREPMQVIEGG